jgi:hypothetical protein
LRNLQHHRTKTFVVGWHDRQLGNGTVSWISPTGHTYWTTPGGADLFPRLGQAACREPKPLYRSRSQGLSSRIERAHALFYKGNQPSTSPFSAWINEPMEPEELPADWRPPPAPPSGPDDPPF